MSLETTEEGLDLQNLEDIYQLSPMQQGMLFHSIFEPGSGVYVSMSIYGVKGSVDVPAFERAWQKVVERHSILRTAFLWEDLEKPVQVVQRHVSISIEQLDWRERTSEEQEQELDDLIASIRKRGFELASAPLMRLVLARLSDESYKFLFSWHHLLLDRWSRALVMKEVMAFYESFCKGEDLVLDQPVPYGHYIKWLDDQDLTAAKSFWQSCLAGLTQPTTLPIDRKSPDLSDEDKDYDRELIEFSEADTNRFKAFARKHKLTFNTVLQGAWALILARYSGSENVIFGVTVSGRTPELPGVESIVGLFINTLPMRVNVPPDAPVLSWLSDLQERQLTLQQYEYTSLLDIQTWSEVPRGTPLFENILAFENIPVRSTFRPENQGIEFRAERGLGSTGYPLTLTIMPHQELKIYLSYDCARFERESIKRLLGHLGSILEGLVADPTRKLAQLSILTEADWRQVVPAWNRAEDYSRDRCIHQLFEEQVARTPEKTAVVFEAEELSYRELNERANQLARYLQSQGVGPEVLVAVCLERSLELVIALLAVLKAGAAYVPLDPDYPEQRLAFMLGDLQGPFLLTDSGLLDKLPQDARTVCLDRISDRIAQESRESPVNRACADNLAYVIYTSGSTGKPKGVQVTHRNVVRLFDETWCWFEFDQRDVWTLFHSYAFDFSVWELWGALNYGGRLVVVPYWVSRSPEAFYDLLCRQQVTVLNQTPSAFRQLIEAEESLGRSADLVLRLVIFGGEALDPESLRPWFERHGDEQPQLVNMYGITETTVHVTYRPLTVADLERSSVSVIGDAIADLPVYVLDLHQQPAPIGVPGELYVGGGGVARGYLQRPELTAERFVPDSLSGRPGARLYKTGDLVRYAAQGELEYLGRVDNQVKVRGFRIELGEIETVLSQHPAVRQSVVVTREDSTDKRLVAYVVPDEKHAFSRASRVQTDDSGLPAWRTTQTSLINDLRQSLEKRLPEYMVPAAFVLLESMPLTPNGKIDRRALPAPDYEARLQDDYLAPRTPVEKALTEIWSNILGIEKVGIHDNFFELGGDSILCIRIVSRANKASLGITPKQMFQYQTIAELASVAGTARFVQAEQDTVSGPVPLTPIQHWLFEQNIPDIQHFNQATLLEVSTHLDFALLQRVVQHLLLHHDALRLRFVREQSGWRQSNAGPEGAVPFELVDLSTTAETEREAVMRSTIAAVQASLNLSEGPLLKIVFFNLGPLRPGRLLMVIHHLAIDGMSWRILLEDLETACEQLSRSEPIKLPAKTTSFKRWAEQLVEQAGSGIIANEQSYWLADERRKVRPLPVDHSNGENSRGSSETVSVSLTVSETQSLLQEMPAAHGTQINDVLLTALTQAFGNWTGELRLLVDLEGHGREEIIEGADLSRTVGWFTTIFPVLLDLSNAGPTNGLKLIRDQLRQVPNRGIGYGLLRYLGGNPGVAGELHSLPQPEVSFNYLGQFGQERSQSDMLSPVPGDIGPMHSPRQTRKHLLNVTGAVAAGQLKVHWTYSKNVHRRDSIEVLANSFISALQSLISTDQLPGAEGFIPSDFPLARLNEKGLTKLAAQLDTLDQSRG